MSIKTTSVFIELDDQKKPITCWFRKVEILLNPDGTEFARKDLPMDRVPYDSDETKVILGEALAAMGLQLEQERTDTATLTQQKADAEAAHTDTQAKLTEALAQVAELTTERDSLTTANADVGAQSQAATARVTELEDQVKQLEAKVLELTPKPVETPPAA